MITILKKEINGFFSTTAGYVIIIIFLLVLGLMMWVLPDFSVFEYPYASLDGLFGVAPIMFLFLIPAICMRSFSDEFANGTMEFLFTKPVSSFSIVMGKWLGCMLVVLLALIPTFVYVYTIWTLGSPQGNVDLGQVAGSYFGLIFLASVYAAIGVFASTLSRNSVTAFVLALAICLLLHYGLFFLSRLPIFSTVADLTIQKAGIDFHYSSISRGVVELRDVVYFSSLTAFFIAVTHHVLRLRRD